MISIKQDGSAGSQQEQTSFRETDYESNIDWFEWEWEWVRSNKEYPTTATPQDLKTLGAEILENYSVKIRRQMMSLTFRQKG